MKFIKRALLGLFGLIAIVALVAFIWSALPVTVKNKTPDPAMVYLNESNPEAPQFREGYFEHKGRKIHYLEAGEGDPIVFVHGFPSYWLSFVRQAKDLRPDYRVILIDGLGAGRSDAPKTVSDYKMKNMTAHLAALLDSLDVEKTHLVGHDWGSGFVFSFAQAFPDRVKTVTGIGSPPVTVMLEMFENNPAYQEQGSYVEVFKKANPVLILGLRVPGKIWEKPYLEHVENGHLSMDEAEFFRDAFSDPKRINSQINWYRANLPSVDEISEDDYWPVKGAKLTMPAQIIWGKGDPIYVPESIEVMKVYSSDLKIIEYDDVGHWPHVEASDEVNQALRVFLKVN